MINLLADELINNIKTMGANELNETKIAIREHFVVSAGTQEHIDLLKAISNRVSELTPKTRYADTLAHMESVGLGNDFKSKYDEDTYEDKPKGERTLEQQQAKEVADTKDMVSKYGKVSQYKVDKHEEHLRYEVRVKGLIGDKADKYISNGMQRYLYTN